MSSSGVWILSCWLFTSSSVFTIFCFSHLNLPSPSLCWVSFAYIWRIPFQFGTFCLFFHGASYFHFQLHWHQGILTFFSQTLGHTPIGYGKARQDLSCELIIQASSKAIVARSRSQFPCHLDQCLDHCELLSTSCFGKCWHFIFAPQSSLWYDQPVP